MPTLFTSANTLQLKEVTSTNLYVKDLLQMQSLPEGFWVQAEYQTLGRGQFGNHWEAQSGKNLLFSFLLKPKFLKASQGFALNMSVCLALHDVLKSWHSHFKIKWPNDLLFQTKKLGGILIENTISGSYFQSSVVGVGLNLNQRQFSSAQATSLALIFEENIDSRPLVQKIQKALNQRYFQLKEKGWLKLKQEYLEQLYGFNTVIPLQEKNGTFKGCISDVSPDGFLQVITPQGQQMSYGFKEVRFIL